MRKHEIEIRCRFTVKKRSVDDALLLSLMLQVGGMHSARPKPHAVKGTTGLVKGVNAIDGKVGHALPHKSSNLQVSELCFSPSGNTDVHTISSCRD